MNEPKHPRLALFAIGFVLLVVVWCLGGVYEGCGIPDYENGALHEPEPKP